MTTENTPELRLPRPPGVLRRWLAAHPRWVDGVIVACYLFGCALTGMLEVASLFVTRDHQAEATSLPALDWARAVVGVLAAAVVALALAYRRRFPLAGVIVVSASVLLPLGYLALPNSVAIMFLLYAVPVYRGVAAGWLGFGISGGIHVVAAVLAIVGVQAHIGPTGILASEQFNWRDGVAIAVTEVLWLLLVLLIGINFGNRRRYVEALIDRAHQLAREREQRAQLAAANERSRIAREMHDIVAHSLSVMVTLTEGASVAIDTKPEAAKQATERAAETGRSALVEMRRLLGVLQEPGASPRAPQPGYQDLHAIIDGFRAAGLEIRLTESGATAAKSSTTHQLAVFRIVQESLTNSLKHAGSVRVDVELEFSEAGARIAVQDYGQGGNRDHPHPKSQTLPGSGQGLRGAYERARMFGGTFEAGPNSLGWYVRAHVPYTGQAQAEQGYQS